MHVCVCVHTEGDGGFKNPTCLGEGVSPYILLAHQNGYFAHYPFKHTHTHPSLFPFPHSFCQGEFILSRGHCGACYGVALGLLAHTAGSALSVLTKQHWQEFQKKKHKSWITNKDPFSLSDWLCLLSLLECV